MTTLSGFDLQLVRTDYWLGLAAMAALIAAMVWLGQRRSGAWRLSFLAMAALLAMRIILVGNPLSWQWYAGVLDADQVGWRQYDLVKIQREHYLKPSGELRYLAVGSSQTEAVYGRAAQQRADLDLFVVAAMMPMDFVLYADEIARRKPQTVLLYLSDFDIAKRPTAEAMVVAPRQGADLLNVAYRLLALQGPADLDRALVELAAGEPLPEFKFRFVFRGIVDRYLRRVANRVGAHESRHRTPASVGERIRWLRESLAAEYIDFNLAWLEDFLARMQHAGIEVVIVEGGYHPAVPNAEMAGWDARVRNNLESLAGRYDGVRFVPRSAVLRFGADDYHDLTHVTPEAGERFTRRLLNVLDANSPRVVPITVP
jgi:hypothetical protein